MEICRMVWRRIIEIHLSVRGDSIIYLSTSTLGVGKSGKGVDSVGNGGYDRSGITRRRSWVSLFIGNAQ
jgi:hypothetical protein